MFLAFELQRLWLERLSCQTECAGYRSRACMHKFCSWETSCNFEIQSLNVQGCASPSVIHRNVRFRPSEDPEGFPRKAVIVRIFEFQIRSMSTFLAGEEANAWPNTWKPPNSTNCICIYDSRQKIAGEIFAWAFHCGSQMESPNFSLKHRWERIAATRYNMRAVWSFAERIRSECKANRSIG